MLSLQKECRALHFAKGAVVKRELYKGLRDHFCENITKWKMTPTSIDGVFRFCFFVGEQSATEMLQKGISAADKIIPRICLGDEGFRCGIWPVLSQLRF